ncbi:MAG TPA: Hsp70 family protein, partial [Ktedonobacterales bacterium]|nr:Hsp70 family protein [Ktedonobacterales bacterium]
MGAAVGIDLGTTYSVVAHVGRDGRPTVLKSEYGSPTTPSVVYLGPGGPIVGEEAKIRQVAEPDRVAAFFKRDMGDPDFSLNFDGVSYTPVDLSALVLTNLKQTAERALGESVTDAIITVPAYFTDPQREATKEAGRRAGLHVLDIINEPSSAARAYGFQPGGTERTLLVYDLGGGTFDVSLVRLSETAIDVLATDGDHRLGGRDWDGRLVLAIASLFEQEFGSELSGEEMQALLPQVEALKRALSAREQAPLRVSAEGHQQTYTITREAFESDTQDLLARTEMLCNETLQAAGLRWADLSGILPVGGSTRMPMVRSCIERLSGQAPLAGVNPDEAVGIGAAITAALAIEEVAKREIFVLPGRKRINDITAHSLGLIAESEDGSRYLNSRVIAKNSPIPCGRTRSYTLVASAAADTLMEVFLTQGELDDPQACVYPGLYELTGFSETPGASFTVDVTYQYRADGTIDVAGVERQSGRSLTVTRKPVPADVPRRFLQPPATTMQTEPLTLYLAFDLSGSMRGAPLAEAKNAAHAFVSNCDLATTAVGLISFSDRVAVDQAATNHNASIERAIDTLAIGRTGLGNLGQPFDELLSRLERLSGNRYAVVLADGVWVNQRRAIAA